MRTHYAPTLPHLASAIAVDGRPRYIIAAHAEIPPNTLRAIIVGRRAATTDERSRLASALDRDVRDLFPEDGAE